MREKHDHTSGGWRKKGWLRDVETFDLGLCGWVGKMGSQARVVLRRNNSRAKSWAHGEGILVVLLSQLWGGDGR